MNTKQNYLNVRKLIKGYVNAIISPVNSRYSFLLIILIAGGSCRMLFFLSLTLLLLLMLSIYLNRGVLVSPSVCFVGGFTAASIACLLYSPNWSFDLHAQALLIILLGILLFIVFEHLTIIALEHFYQKRTLSYADPNESSVSIPAASSLVVFGFLIIAATVWQVATIHSFYQGASVSESVSLYRYAGTFTTERLSFAFPLSTLRGFCLGGGYYLSFLAAIIVRNRNGYSRSTLILVLVDYVLLLIMSLSTGGRAAAIGYVFVLFACYLLEPYISGHDYSLSRKEKMGLIIACTLLVLVFPLVAVGRSLSVSLIDYLAIYIGAPIRNFDIYLETNPKHAINIWGGMTFIRTINYIGYKLGIDKWIYVLDLPFLPGANGHTSGNVYTTFYAFHYDFGIAGVIVLVIIMAIISAALFYFASNSKGRWYQDFVVPTYAVCCYQLTLSFFSNKFYEDFASTTFLRSFIYMLLAIFILKCLPSHFSSKDQLTITGVRKE